MEKRQRCMKARKLVEFLKLWKVLQRWIEGLRKDGLTDDQIRRKLMYSKCGFTRDLADRVVANEPLR